MVMGAFMRAHTNLEWVRASRVFCSPGDAAERLTAYIRLAEDRPDRPLR